MNRTLIPGILAMATIVVASNICLLYTSLARPERGKTEDGGEKRPGLLHFVYRSFCARNRTHGRRRQAIAAFFGKGGENGVLKKLRDDLFARNRRARRFALIAVEET